MNEQLIAALQRILDLAPDEEPEAETYDDTESAYNNGHDVAAWEAAMIADKVLVLALALQTEELKKNERN